MTTFKVKPSPHPHTLEEREAALAELKFGKAFTDHMARATWEVDTGWSDYRVEAYAPLLLDPATAVLHYAQEVFEGLKAYRHADGSVWTFRPEANAARLAASARRIALPEVSEEMFLASIETLVRTDVEWVPSIPGSSLYLRPFMFASERFIGVRSAHKVDYIVIASPVGPYFAAGFTPVSIWVERDFNRAGPGGTGAAKFGGNYAASLLPQQVAAQNGCDQVCFLDAATGTRIEELGGMNTFFVTADGALHTPALSGTILEGITRSSIIEFARARGREVHEREITLDEVRNGIESGEIVEVFACGTAAVITPIGTLKSTDFEVTINNGEPGPITQEIYERITDIQYGRADDEFGWMRRLA